MVKSRRLGVLLLTLFVLAVLQGCSREKKKTSDVSQEGKPPVAVEVSAVAEEDLTEGIEVVGQLTPKFEAEIRSEVTGIVSKVYVNEWLKVSKGTPLIALDARELEAIVKRNEAEIGQEKVRLNRAEREHERNHKLKEAGLVTQQNLDDALTEKLAAESAIKSLEESLTYARTRLSKTVIYSPLDGTVAMRSVNTGDLVGDPGMQKVLFKIVDNRILNLTVRVPSKEMSGLKTGQPIVFTTDALPGESFKGKVMYINPVVDEHDRAVKVIAEVSNVPEKLKGGLFVKGRIVTGSKPKALTVPSTALISWNTIEKKAEVFVLDKDKAVKKAVVTGILFDGRVEIVSGLKKGDAVVERGGFNIKEGDNVIVVKKGDK